MTMCFHAAEELTAPALPLSINLFQKLFVVLEEDFSTGPTTEESDDGHDFPVAQQSRSLLLPESPKLALQ